ncbi:DNA-binding MarR family transcriptional regulator [Altererythrobacter atlanticus]|uniref:MarR family winged helix-turn-helix transcriptional regulator n=1 Tax=Croceibacterium atlanticum TaxID=1267766 RepID=UPI00062C1DE8|nr:MarR family transcriptional regulator [Croceibacterium atlanticum]MBB5732453.1 DNA-binding MarR family transcriptional regulator [Croceibacterium atlanticum]
MQIDTDTKAAWSEPLAGVQRELLGAHFLLLGRLLRKSARRDFAGVEPDSQMERRIVLTLYRLEEARVSELAIRLGNDVSQVSRALRAGRDSGIVERERQRDPYRLTEKGKQLGALIDEVASRREEQLTKGLSAQEMFELASLLGILMHNAAQILAEETARARDGAEAEDPADQAMAEMPSRVQPAVINLATLIIRGATLSFKRLTGISNYEWRILANVAYRPSIPFMEIVNHVDSDKAQVSRALDAMVGANLLERSKGGRNEPVRFQLTDEGWRIHDIMLQDAIRRNVALVEGLRDVQRRRLQSYVDLLNANAAEMAENCAAGQD